MSLKEFCNSVDGKYEPSISNEEYCYLEEPIEVDMIFNKGDSNKACVTINYEGNKFSVCSTNLEVVESGRRAEYGRKLPPILKISSYPEQVSVEYNPLVHTIRISKYDDRVSVSID